MKEKAKKLERENEALKARLEEAEANLRAIKGGEVDALVVSGPQGEQVFTLKDANHPYRIIIEEMEEGAFTLTDEGTILYSNKQFAAMVKTSLPKLIGSSIYDYLDKSNSRVIERLLTYEPGRTRKGEVIFGQHSKGRMYAYVSFRPLEIDGRSMLSGVITDITPLKKGEEARARLMAAIQQAVDTVVITNLKGEIQYANPASERLTGFNRDEIIGKSLDIFGSHKGRKLIQSIHDALKNGDRWQGQVTGEKKDGSPYELDVRASAIRDNDGRFCNYIIIGHDVTHELKLQEQLRHMQRLEAVGRLAGGIAHDLNNILHPIIVNSELLLGNALPGGELHQRLTEILKAADRQRDLVKQILVFSKQGEQKQIPIDVDSLVKEEVKFLRSTLPSTIEIRKDIAGESCTIMGDATQIHQIVMNLCSNAADAIIPETGMIEIRLDNMDLEEAAEYPDLGPGRYLRLTVSDTGRGMKPALLERIFDPFFTTKEQGKGTGMGLAVVHGIIKKHGGAVKVESEPGKGTRFDVLFPVVEPVEEEMVPRPEPSVPRGRGRVLVVDDEEAVVDTIEQVLKRHGYDVVSTTSSLEALDLFRRESETFDLVISDQTMPQMTGLQLTGKLLNIRQDIPIILCTGYSDVLREEDEIVGIRAVLMKPANIRELMEVVQNTLANSTSV